MNVTCGDNENIISRRYVIVASILSHEGECITKGLMADDRLVKNAQKLMALSNSYTWCFHYQYARQLKLRPRANISFIYVVFFVREHLRHHINIVGLVLDSLVFRGAHGWFGIVVMIARNATHCFCQSRDNIKSI